MRQTQEKLAIDTPGQGFVEITRLVQAVVRRSGIATGLCHVFVQHTSCSLCIQENADPSARRDMERWLSRIAPENDPDYTHTSEGPDDMPSHLRAMVTKTGETIPVSGGRLAMGTWQGLYLCEHRRRSHRRFVVVSVSGT
ncbi:MAG: secondary thiamine-phosphate synthase enzyme YjbQ [Planctomycetota bacterium]|jgi:secondary thiamine-phosphate synthase enzyme